MDIAARRCDVPHCVINAVKCWRKGNGDSETDRRTDGLRSAQFALKSGGLNTWRKVLPTAVDCSRDLHPLNREELILQARRFSICVTLHSDCCSCSCSCSCSCVLHAVTRCNGLPYCLKINMFCRKFISLFYLAMFLSLHCFISSPFICVKRRDVQYKSAAHTFCLC